MIWLHLGIMLLGLIIGHGTGMAVGIRYTEKVKSATGGMWNRFTSLPWGSIRDGMILTILMSILGLHLSTSSPGCILTPTPTPPIPIPVPPTPPTPVPINDLGLRMLIIYDSQKESTMPAAQLAILSDKSIRDYLNAKCPLGPDGKTHDWRIWPDGADVVNDPSTAIKSAYAHPRASLPWIVVSNGKDGFEGPLPATVADTVALLKKYGG